MAVKIMIKRKVSSEKLSELLPYLKYLRVLAMSQWLYRRGNAQKNL